MEISNKKRELPRHVDGRIMVGIIPLKNFFLMLPIAIGIVVLVVLFFSPLVFFAGVFILAIVVSLFSEFHQRETGFTIIKDIIKFYFKGDILFERNSRNVKPYKRFIENKIKKDIR